MERDRISELPADILDKIFVLLPVVQAARIAILSTKLRDSWSNLTQLKFDKCFCRYIQDKYWQYYQNLSAVLYVINKVLMNHKGLILKVVFEFKFPRYGRHLARSRAFDFDQWLFCVTQKGVKDISFTLYDGEMYQLPGCLFYCQTLKSLHIHGVCVELRRYPPAIWQNVTSLCFNCVNFVSQYDLNLFLVHLPMLEYLSLSGCEAEYVSLSIVAPKLGTLKLRSKYGTNPLGPFSMDLKSVCSLDLESHSLKNFLENIINKVTSRGAQLQPPTTTLNVECLKISSSSGFHQHDDSMSAFIGLLQMCPKLCKLDIHISGVAAEKVINKVLVNKVYKETQLCKTLHVLELSSFNNSWQFIKRLPFYFPALEKIVIHYAKFASEKEFEIMQKILESIRNSTKVKLTVTKTTNLA